MRYYFIVLCFLAISIAGYGQAGAKRNSVRAGMRLGNEKINYYSYNKSGIVTGSMSSPDKSNCVLFYRFGDKNSTDSYDSLSKVLSTIYQIRNASAANSTNFLELPTRFVFYAFVKEINAQTRVRYYKMIEQKSKVIDSLVNLHAYRKTCNVEVMFIKDSLKPVGILSARKVSIINANGTLLSSSPVLKFSENKKTKQRLIKGMLLTETDGQKVPLVNAKVFLYQIGRTSADSAVTNTLGNFELLTYSDTTNYNFEARPESVDVNNIILATQNGQHIMNLRRADRNFEYKLIRADIVKLTEMNEKDITLPFKEQKLK